LTWGRPKERPFYSQLCLCRPPCKMQPCTGRVQRVSARAPVAVAANLVSPVPVATVCARYRRAYVAFLAQDAFAWDNDDSVIPITVPASLRAAFYCHVRPPSGLELFIVTDRKIAVAARKKGAAACASSLFFGGAVLCRFCGYCELVFLSPV